MSTRVIPRMNRKRAQQVRAEYIAKKTDNGLEMVDFMLAVLRDPASEVRDRMAAASWLDERGYAGKPSERVEIDVSVAQDDRALDSYLDSLSLEDQITLRGLLEKVTSAPALPPAPEVIDAEVVES